MSEKKSGFVGVIGKANVGKSTLVNKIVGQKIAITSPKPQTTRKKARAVFTDERGQIVFLDTPGIHKSRSKLGDYMMSSAWSTFADADVVLWLVEPSDHFTETEELITEKLGTLDCPVILVINKIDTISPDKLLEFIASYSEHMDFKEVVPVSALKGKNVDDLVNTVFKYLPEGEPFYDEDTVTDQPVKQIAAEIIREKALMCLGEEVPHGLAVAIDSMKYEGTMYNIDATIYCEKDSHKGMIIGKGGSKLKEIGSKARPEIEELCESKVFLKLWVKVKKDWRDSDIQLKNFGFDKSQL
ncbi:MAG: GTPase Era [Lachnospiraceae bacterium]|nr:GTPase Era [Lachnospiraceae bacterium]MBP1586254.1 GTPase Era [Lachnospiraceae bacterium]